MNKLSSNIISFFLICFVLFLSIGTNISKMQCSKGDKLFFGTEVPNCVDEKKKYCNINIEEFSCCAKEKLLESCCRKNDDNSCASEITIIQFDFETLLCYFDFSVNLFPVNIHRLFVYNDSFEDFFISSFKNEPPVINLIIIFFQTFLL